MLLPITVGYVAGLALGSFLPFLPLTIFSLLLLVLGVLVFLERRGLLPPWKGHLSFGSLVVGLVFWTIASGPVDGETLLQRVGPDPVQVTGRIVEPIRQGPERIIFALSDLVLTRSPESISVGGKLRVTWRNPDLALGQGDRIGLIGRLREPSGMVNPGGFHYEGFLARKGIDAVVSLSGPEQVVLVHRPPSASRWGFWRKVDEWRERIRRVGEGALTEPAFGLFLGLMIGEQGFISPDIRDAFMITGTVHILSISGSHLGLVALLAFAGIRQSCRLLPAAWLLALSRRVTPIRLAASGTAAPVMFYALLAGSEVATVRSLIMILVFLLAVWLGRAEQLLLALAAATVVILGLDPLALYDISFQLSFVSVLTIALVVRWYLQKQEEEAGERSGPSLLHRVGTWAQAFALVTVGVTLTTLPLVALYFNQIAWMGLLCNFLVVPVAGILLVPLGLASVVWLLVSGSETLPFGLLQQVLLDWTVELVQWLARMPGGEWHVASPTIPAMLAFYLALGIAFRPGWNLWIRGAGGLGVILLVTWWVWSPRHLPDGLALRVTFLDVGQGDACLIELPGGQTVLIDAGAHYDQLDMGRAVVGPYLWDRGIRRLDHVIGTHPQLDHVGGLPWIFQKFDVGRFWSNEVPREEVFYQRLRDAVRQAGVTESLAVQGTTVHEAEGCRLEVLNPPRDMTTGPPVTGSSAGISPARSGTSLNNNSVVTRLDCGPHSLLFTADLETEGLLRLTDNWKATRIEVLKVPHHGARSSLELEWIRSVRPAYAVISVGRRNPYGHPAPQVLAAYEQIGTRLFRTDRDGAVWITGTLKESGLEVHTAREELPQPVRLGAGLWDQERPNLGRVLRQWWGP